jgi:hypothetical protein
MSIVGRTRTLAARDDSSRACSSSGLPPLLATSGAFNARCASFPHHGNNRCRSLDELIVVLLDGAIRGVKFLAGPTVWLDVKFFATRGQPFRQYAQRHQAQLRGAAAHERYGWPRSAIGPRKRQIATTSVGKLGIDRVVSARPDDHRLMAIPRMRRKGDLDR